VFCLHFSSSSISLLATIARTHSGLAVYMSKFAGLLNVFYNPGRTKKNVKMNSCLQIDVIRNGDIVCPLTCVKQEHTLISLSYYYSMQTSSINLALFHLFPSLLYFNNFNFSLHRPHTLPPLK
jgi:hypothetical protein